MLYSKNAKRTKTGTISKDGDGGESKGDGRKQRQNEDHDVDIRNSRTDMRVISDGPMYSCKKYMMRVRAPEAE